jgi:hypothetical protein
MPIAQEIIMTAHCGAIFSHFFAVDNRHGRAKNLAKLDLDQFMKRIHQ